MNNLDLKIFIAPDSLWLLFCPHSGFILIMDYILIMLQLCSTLCRNGGMIIELLIQVPEKCSDTPFSVRTVPVGLLLSFI